MWQIEPVGLAHWQSSAQALPAPSAGPVRAGGGVWTVQTAGGIEGISLRRGDRAQPLVTLEPVGSDRLPRVAEQFVRRDELHLDYPQGDGEYALQFVLRPIEANERRLILEWTISVQTSLLETHPMLDLRVPKCKLLDRQSPPVPSEIADEVPQRPTDAASGAAAISQGRQDGLSVTVLLGPHDYPWTADLSNDQELRLRLFGEFLEKGVIRKARPWIVIDADGEPGQEKALIETWHQLCRSPLPLRS